MLESPLGYREYSVRAADRQPLVTFMLDSLKGAGCRILSHSPPNRAPFCITFESPTGDRIGVVAYAFLANRKLTQNRPTDEHRFQLGNDNSIWPHRDDDFWPHPVVMISLSAHLPSWRR